MRRDWTRFVEVGAVVLTAGLGNQPAGNAATLRVAADGTEDFSSVAVAADAAASGDSVLVFPGRYDDAPVRVRDGKSLCISGEGNADAIHLGKGVYSPGTGSGVLRLRGLTIDGGTEDIGFVGIGLMAEVELLDLICRNGRTCVVMSQCSKINVQACVFSDIDNVIGTNGGGLSISRSGIVRISECTFSRNHSLAGADPSSYASGGGGLFINMSAGDATEVTKCVFYENNAPRGSAAAIGGNGNVAFHHNTIVRNRGGESAIYAFGAGVTIEDNVMADNDGFGLFDDGIAGGVTCACNAFWLNRGSDGFLSHRQQWWGLCGRQADGSAEELWDDPQFCDIDGERFGVTSMSPLLPQNRDTSVGSCMEVVGARDAECEPNPPAVAPMSWGSIKARYGN